MKKIIPLLFTLATCLMISGCGDVSNVGTSPPLSDRYSEQELNSAYETVKSYFWKNYDGSTLDYISFDDKYNESVREDNIWFYRTDFAPGADYDILELSVMYDGNSDLMESFTLSRVGNGSWKVHTHGY